MKKIIILLIFTNVLFACPNAPVAGEKAASTPSGAQAVNNKSKRINFKKFELNKTPDGFTQTCTGAPQTIDWKVVNDNGNKVVAQLGKNKGRYYNLLVLDKFYYRNFKMSVKIKAFAGIEDQGGGLVWRYIDNNNYYLARCNPLENNFRFYRVVNGDRKQLQSVECNIKTGEWFTLAIEMKNNKISCSLNNNKVIEAVDDTFPNAGRVGFWSKADAQTYFDDLTISPVK